MWGILPVLSTTRLNFRFLFFIAWEVNKSGRSPGCFAFSNRLTLRSSEGSFLTGSFTKPALVSVLVPFCVAQFTATDDAVANIKMTRHGHDDVIREFVKRVVDTQMDYSFARACAATVDDPLAMAAAKGSPDTVVVRAPDSLESPTGGHHRTRSIPFHHPQRDNDQHGILNRELNSRRAIVLWSRYPI